MKNHNEHDGKVIFTERLMRRCGHYSAFLHYEHDPHRDRRREKFTERRCPACGQEASNTHNEIQNQRAKERLESVGARDVRILPGVVSVTITGSGQEWTGSLTNQGRTVTAECPSPQNLLWKLQRQFFQQGAS